MKIVLISKLAKIKSQFTMYKEFKYLGVIFTKITSFSKSIKHNFDQAKKVMRLSYKRIRYLNLPINIQLQLFYKNYFTNGFEA